MTTISQVKQNKRIKRNQLNHIKQKTKIHWKQVLNQLTWHKIKTWRYLELITSAKRAKCYF